jgi:hypothetical protein
MTPVAFLCHCLDGGGDPHVHLPTASGTGPCTRCGHPIDEHQTPGMECVHLVQTGHPAEGSHYCVCGGYQQEGR